LSFLNVYPRIYLYGSGIKNKKTEKKQLVEAKMTRLTSFTKFFGIGVTAGSLVAARHCYDLLSETSLEVNTLLVRIDRTGRELPVSMTTPAPQVAAKVAASCR
jgi:hypothetical protein